MELLRQIEQEGEHQIQEVLVQAQTKAQEIIAQTEREITEQREHTLKELQVRLEHEHRATISRARAQARSEFLQAKSHIAAELFERLANEMIRVRADGALYRKFLQHCLQEAERAIPGALVLHMDPEYQKIAQELTKKTGHRLGDPIQTIGGLLATNEQGDLVVDNRLETRLANLRARHRAELGRIFSEPHGD
jgi:vacuolar-type H+-ATPase subunit E/Vma4